MYFYFKFPLVETFITLRMVNIWLKKLLIYKYIISYFTFNYFVNLNLSILDNSVLQLFIDTKILLTNFTEYFLVKCNNNFFEQMNYLLQNLLHI